MDWATDILRSRGYFSGGALLQWFGTDGLLMQKVLDEPSWDDMVLVSDRARDLAKQVRADWQRTRTNGAGTLSMETEEL